MTLEAGTLLQDEISPPQTETASEQSQNQI